MTKIVQILLHNWPTTSCPEKYQIKKMLLKRRPLLSHDQQNYSIKLHNNPHPSNPFSQGMTKAHVRAATNYHSTNPVGKAMFKNIPAAADFSSGTVNSLPGNFFPPFESPIWKQSIDGPPYAIVRGAHPSVGGEYCDHPKAVVTYNSSSGIAQSLARLADLKAVEFESRNSFKTSAHIYFRRVNEQFGGPSCNSIETEFVVIAIDYEQTIAEHLKAIIDEGNRAAKILCRPPGPGNEIVLKIPLQENLSLPAMIVTFEAAKIQTMHQHLDSSVKQPIYIDVCERRIPSYTDDDFPFMFGNDHATVLVGGRSSSTRRFYQDDDDSDDEDSR